jgi:hypothetical protein
LLAPTARVDWLDGRRRLEARRNTSIAEPHVLNRLQRCPRIGIRGKSDEPGVAYFCSNTNGDVGGEGLGGDRDRHPGTGEDVYDVVTRSAARNVSQNQNVLLRLDNRPDRVVLVNIYDLADQDGVTDEVNLIRYLLDLRGLNECLQWDAFCCGHMCSKVLVILQKALGKDLGKELVQ